MIYVYVDSKRMAYLKLMLNAESLSDVKQLHANDTLVFPPVKETVRTIPLQKGELNLAALHQMRIFIPNVNQYLKEDNDVYYYMRDEEVAVKNAKLTAAGLLSYLLNLELFFIDWKVDVIGYGHCGKAIYDLLKAMDVEVRMIRREKGKQSFYAIEEYKKMKKGNIVINTSPSNPFDANDFKDDTLYLIDISTEKCYPKTWTSETMQIIYPGSLPNQCAPFSSAGLIAQYVRRVCDEK